VIAAFWILGFAMVAVAVGPDEGVRSSALETVTPTDSNPSGKTMPSGFPDPAPELKGVELLRMLADNLQPAELMGVSPHAARIRATEWAKAVSTNGGEPLSAIHEILPSADWFQARLVHPRDEADLNEGITLGGAYGAAYAGIDSLLGQSRASEMAIEAILDIVWSTSPLVDTLASKPVPVLRRSDRWFPAKHTLSASHQYALDVFFTNFKRKGVVETGPRIYTMSRGIVVSAAGDWRGGDRASTYRSGGLSPKAGNGVVIYDPDTRRYYAYFHLSEVFVSAGNLVASGDVIGLGGNTGTNARKKDHGEHVHVEIHDADGDAWTAYAIRDYILSLK